MDLELKASKNCHACGALNAETNTFCTSCGENMLEYEPEEVEIKDTFLRAVKIIKYLFVIPFFLLTVYFLLIVLLLISPFTQGSPTIDEVITLLRASMIMGGFFIGFFVLYKVLYNRANKPRNFFISNTIIKISVPKKPTFEIKWNEFDKIDIKKRASSVWKASAFNPRVVFNDLNFINNNMLLKTFALKVGWDFRFKSCRKIRALLKEYALKLNKQFSYKK